MHFSTLQAVPLHKLMKNVLLSAQADAGAKFPFSLAPLSKVICSSPIVGVSGSSDILHPKNIELSLATSQG